MSLQKLQSMLYRGILVAVLFLSQQFSYAQMAPPAPPPPDPCTDPAEPCPIDSNLYVLFIFILALVLYSNYRKRTASRDVA